MSYLLEQQNLLDLHFLVKNSANAIKDSLQNFANLPGFDEQMMLAFGDNIDVHWLKEEWRSQNFSFPEIEIVSSQQINGANGAFSNQTNKIYLAQEFLIADRSDIDAVTAVLLEEYGHYLDSKLNLVDTPGDEGAIFSALVRGEEIANSELQQLRNEDDSAVVNIDWEEIAIEQNNLDLSALVDGVDNFFNTLQNGLNSEVFGSDLPLFGDSLQDASASSTQFIDNIRTQIIGELLQLENLTPELIRDTINNSLGDVGTVDIVDTGDPDDCRFILTLGESNTDFVALDTSLGFDGLGVSAEESGFGLNLNASADVTTGYQLDLQFGIDETGFYVDTSEENELTVNLDVTNLSGSGELGALRIEVTDNKSNNPDNNDAIANDNSSVIGTFNIDIAGDDDNKFRLSEFASVGFANLIEGDLEVDTNIDLGIQSTVDGSLSLPVIATDLKIDWQNITGQISPVRSLADYNVPDPTVSLDNAEICLDGGFFSNFAGPTLESVRDVIEPIQPVLDALTTPIDLGVRKVNLLDIAELVSDDFDEEDRAFIESLAEFANLINSLPTFSNSETCINLGNLQLPGNIRLPEFEPPEVSNLEPVNPIGDEEGQIEPRSSEAMFYNQLSEMPGEGLQFPILDDPNQVFNLLLGNYDLVEFFRYDLPVFRFEAGYSQYFPILPPLGAEISGTFGANIDLEFGFNGSGLDFARTDDANDNPFDGLFIVDDRGNDGSDEPEVTFDVGLGIFGVIDLGAASGGVGGSIQGNVNFDLRDPTPGDGIVTYTELQRNDGLSNFITSGQLSAGLSAYVRLGRSPFDYTRRFDSPRVVLLNYEEEEREAEPTIALATLLDNGTLRLNMGPNAADRVVGDLEDGAERFLVTSFISSVRSEGFIGVAAFDQSEQFLNVERIVADGGEEDDLIDLSVATNPDLGVPSELSGGNGNDELIGAGDEDTLNGDAGDDVLDGRFEPDTLNGGAGNDFLIGGAGGDVLNGGEGFDVASYITSSEAINLNLATGESTGDATGDIFESIEQIDGSSLGDTLIGSNGSDRFDGGEGNDSIDGGAGDDILLPGDGDDTINGGAGNDILVLNYSQLPTGAVVRNQANSNGASGAREFVSNAYGLDTPYVTLTPSDGFATYSAISADGSTIVRIGYPSSEDRNNWGVYVYRLDNSDAPVTIVREEEFGELYSFGLSPRHIAISDDGSKVAWLAEDPNDNDDVKIYVANADGSNIIEVNIEADYRQFVASIPELAGETEPFFLSGNLLGVSEITLSGDGSTVAWIVNERYNDSGQSLAYVSTAKIENETVEIARSQYIYNDSALVESPNLSFDGSQIVWQQRNSSIEEFRLNSSIDNPQIFTANTNLGEGNTFNSVEQLSPNPAENYYSPAISADGLSVAFAEGNPILGNFFGGDKILIARNNNPPEVIYTVPQGFRLDKAADGTLDYLSLSADGDRIFFALEEESTSEVSLNVINADGTGEPTQLYTDTSLEAIAFHHQALSSTVDIGVRYGDFDAETGSGEIFTWGPSHVQFDSIERFNLTGTPYGDELLGGNGADTLIGTGGADTLIGGDGNDTYQLEASTAAGSQIIDSAGEDTLNITNIINTTPQISANPDAEYDPPEIEPLTISLAQPAVNTIGIAQIGTSLVIDINRDGVANPEADLSILNYFNEAGTDAGTGYIETISNLDGTDIISFLGNGIEPPLNTGTIQQGTTGAEEITGGTGNDTLIGAGGADTLEGGGGNDIYQLDAATSAGSVIRDTVGIDSLELSNGTLTLAEPAVNTIGLARNNTTLIIDLNQDGIINPEEDLSILNYFKESDTGAGNGFIENVANLSGNDILNLLPPSESNNLNIIEEGVQNDNGQTDLGSTVYRFFNPNAGVHFYTASEVERDVVLELPNYTFEGESYNTVDHLSGEAEDVYRFFNTTTGVHLYTTDENERDFIIENLTDFTFEGTAFSAYETEAEGAIPIHRFYEPSIGVHFYTPSEEERTFVEDNLSNYTYEGIAYYAFPLD